MTTVEPVKIVFDAMLAPKNCALMLMENPVLSNRAQYKTSKAGMTWVVRRVEGKVDARGKHTGSIRTVSWHARSADAEQNARALRLLSF
jgi:hypothetical protein